MSGALKSHKQQKDESRRVNSATKDLNQFKDNSDTYGVHICTRDDPIYKDYTSTAWMQQKNVSPSNCKCFTVKLYILSLLSSAVMFTVDCNRLQNIGFQSSYQFRKFLNKFVFFKVYVTLFCILVDWVPCWADLLQVFVFYKAIWHMSVMTKCCWTYILMRWTSAAINVQIYCINFKCKQIPCQEGSFLSLIGGENILCTVVV